MDISELLTTRTFDRLINEGLLWRLRLTIDGIEVTQAVQYFGAPDHLTDPADRAADNSVRLVAGKPAWVRVYVSSLFGASGLTATLEVQRRAAGILWNTVATLNADPSSATNVSGMAIGSYAATRGSLGETVNFIIPADEMIGTLRLIARVSAGSQTAESSTDVAVTLRQTLRLAGVMISYNGPASNAPMAPNLTIAAPTLVDLQNMAGTALTLFPVESTASFRTAGTLTLTNHLQDTTFPTSGCGTQWDALHGRVANARTADGNQPGWIYYGLLPAGVPMGPVGGCGGGGVAVGPINQPGVLAHEAGHACGLAHAPAGGAPNADPGYPAYEPYDPANTPMASTGEYGLDVNNGNLASPQTFRDFMSYAGPAWISLYHYGRLVDNAQLTPRTVGIDHPWWKDRVWEEIRKWPPIPEPDPPFDLDLELPRYPPWRPQDLISLIVRIDHGKVAEVLHVARTRAHPALPGAVGTSFGARLRDREDRVVAEGALQRLDTAAGCSCGGAHGASSYLAQVFLADVELGSRLEITEGDEVVWTRDAPPKPVEVGDTVAKMDRRGNYCDVVAGVGRGQRVLDPVVGRRRGLAIGDDRADPAEGAADGRPVATRAGDAPSGGSRRLLIQPWRADTGCSARPARDGRHPSPRRRPHLHGGADGTALGLARPTHNCARRPCDMARRRRGGRSRTRCLDLSRAWAANGLVAHR